MTIQDLKQQKIAILGLGVNNQELARYLAAHEVGFTVREKKAELREQFEKSYPDLVKFIHWEINDKTLDNLHLFDIVFRSPSIPYLSPALQKAAKKGVVLYSQTKLFFDLCPAPIIGVTGTKGKGTTSSLLFEMLQNGYKGGKVFLAGNIGVDPFAFLPELTENDLVILELSSFQLQDLHKSPHVAILLHITQDHLDHHGSLQEYREAKKPILSHQSLNDIAIVNIEYPEMQALAREVRGKLYGYTKHQPRKQSAWVNSDSGKETLFIQMGQALLSVDISERKILGEHNLENIIPAAIVAALYGASEADIARAVKEFKGLPHRLSLVGSFQGIDFYSDSIATTPESCLVALQAFPGRRVHLIVGGKDKGGDYRALAEEVSRHCPTVSLLPGNATLKLRAKLKGSSALVLDKAVEPLFPTILSGIHPHLRSGDVVLLAPAASSYQPFANYKQRGEAFVKAVLDRYTKSAS